MNPVCEDIKDKMVTAGLGTFAATSGWGIYIAERPNKPDSTITLYDTGGQAPGYCMDRAKPELRLETFQIIIRATSYLGGYSKMQDIISALDQIAPWKVAAVDSADLDVRYTTILRESEPIYLGKEEDHVRFLWSLNYQAFRKEVI